MSRKAEAADTDAPVVRLRAVGVDYAGAEGALDGVDLTLERGSMHLLTGPSGAGKSSLLKLMYLALEPTRGTFELFGRDMARERRSALPLLRRRIGVVFQEFRLLDHLSAFDNVALPLRIAGKRASRYREDVAELLDWVGLGHRLQALPPTLSGGEKQRLAIARAVVGKPELILADEPTGSVDPDMAQRILRLLLELNRMGATVVIATHDRELVERAGAPVLRLEGGRLAPADGGRLARRR